MRSFGGGCSEFRGFKRMRGEVVEVAAKLGGGFEGTERRELRRALVVSKKRNVALLSKSCSTSIEAESFLKSERVGHETRWSHYSCLGLWKEWAYWVGLQINPKL